MVDFVLFLSCAASSIVWFLLLFMPIRWRMSERWEAVEHLPASISKWPSLSVIIPARNESTSLPLTLPSWLGQDYPEAEIILVNDESNQRLPKNVQKLLEHNLIVQCVFLRVHLPHPVGPANYGHLSRELELHDIWSMVARSAFAQLRCSWLALSGTVLGLIILFMAPVTGIGTFIAGTCSPAIILLSIIALLSMGITYVPTLRFFSLSMFHVFTLPINGVLYAAMTVSSAINHLSGRHLWRGKRTPTRL